VRPKIDALVEALQDGDLPRARAAYADYDAGWNGVEVYVNARDLSLYEKLEDDLQSPIGDALEDEQPDLAAQVATAKELGTTFDQAIDNSTAGPPLSPLFDDVTALRIVRSDLRRTADLLEAGDVEGARKRFTTFHGNYGLVQQRVQARSDTADAPLVAAIAAATAAFDQPKATAAAITPLVAAVADRYGFPLGLWNAAARNADLAKDTWTPADLVAVGALREVEAATSTSVEEWGEGEYDEAVAQVTTATSEFEEAEPALTSKDSDSAQDGADGLESALANLRSVVARDGSDAVVAVAARAADEAAQIAEQVVVGQFWTDAAAIRHR
jgi:hypothetical protein